LRKAQRINGAIERKKTCSEIIKASKEDSKLFYKLINKQQQTLHLKFPYNDENFNTPSQICDGIYKYFRDLAIPKDDPLGTDHLTSRGELWFFSKKYSDFGGGKKNLIQSFCHIT
jgi:hypothetical protein